MNQTAIKAALSTIKQQKRLYAALRLTAIGKHKRPLVKLFNRYGYAFMAVRWDRIKGFTITDKQGHNITRLVFNELRA